MKRHVAVLGACLMAGAAIAVQAQSELIFSDDFDLAESVYDIGFGAEGRQDGSSGRLSYLEREEHMAGGLADEYTAVQDGKLVLYTDGTTWVSPDYNFVDGPTFQIEVSIDPTNVDPSRSYEDWAALVFGATAPGMFVNASDGMGILFRNNGGYQVFDRGTLVYSSTEEDVLPAGELRLRVEVSGQDFLGNTPATVEFFVNDAPLRITDDGGNAYTRAAGFEGNYLTLLGYASAGNYLWYLFDDLEIRADACVHFTSGNLTLRPGDPAPSVTVKVPEALASGDGGTVVVRSSNPSVVNPAGGEDGEIELNFAGTAPADLTATIDLEVLGKGGAQLELVTSYPGCVAAPLSVAILSAHVRNPSFEDNTITTYPGYGAVEAWEGASGVNSMGVSGGGPFHDNGVYPDGSNIGFRQGAGVVSQEIAGLTPGERYWLQLRYNVRNCCGDFVQNMTVRFDGVEIGLVEGIRPVGADNPYRSRTFEFTPAAGTGLLEIEGSGANDHTLLLDAITIVPREEGNVIVINPSFEASGPVSGTGVFAPPLRISGWEGEGVFGVNLGGAGPFADNGTVPDQDLAAFIQGPGALRQTLAGLLPGQTYTVSFAVNARSGDFPNLRVEAGPAVVFEGEIEPVGGSEPYRVVTGTFVADASQVELAFIQTKEGEHTVLLDDVRVLGESVDLPPIEVSARNVELGVGVAGSISVTVPEELMALGPATVTVTSEDPAVAAMTGAANGTLTLSFDPAGERTQVFEIEALSRGSTVLRLGNPQGAPFNFPEIGVVVSGALVRNPSFEANSHPTAPGYGPIDAWDSEGPGNTGINTSAGPFHDNGIIPDRAQIALLQTTETLRQEVAGLTPGASYWLQFHFNARNCCGGFISLTPRFAGVDLDFIDSVLPVGEDMPYLSRSLPFVPASDSGLLEFVAVAEGDATVLLDGVTIVQRDEDDIVVMNPSFEASGRVPFPGYIQPANIAGWEGFGGGRGVNESGVGPFADNGVNPDQDSVAFLQNPGTGIRQTLNGLTPGTSYVISVAVNARGGNTPRLRISADETILLEETIAPVGGSNPYRVLEAGFVAENDTVTIAFEQTADGDQTVLLDDVRVRPGTAQVRPRVQVAAGDAGIRLSWPQSAEGYVLQVAETVDGPWSDSDLPVTVEDGQNVVTDSPTEAARFYRLARE